jgi:hypothetical protein
MIKIIHFFLLGSISLTIYSCYNDQEINKTFVEKYENENFEDFTCKGVSIRGGNNQQGVVVLVSNSYEKVGCRAPVGVILNRETGAFKSLNRDLLGDECEIDEKEMINLALKFIEYKVAVLAVDSNKNVLINISEAEAPNLIRFSDMKYKTQKFRRWKKIKGSWYERR